jgi:hypothetical protein
MYLRERKRGLPKKKKSHIQSSQNERKINRIIAKRTSKKIINHPTHLNTEIPRSNVSSQTPQSNFFIDKPVSRIPPKGEIKIQGQ